MGQLFELIHANLNGPIIRKRHESQLLKACRFAYKALCNLTQDNQQQKNVDKGIRWLVECIDNLLIDGTSPAVRATLIQAFDALHRFPDRFSFRNDRNALVAKASFQFGYLLAEDPLHPDLNSLGARSSIVLEDILSYRATKSTAGRGPLQLVNHAHWGAVENYIHSLANDENELAERQDNSSKKLENPRPSTDPSNNAARTPLTGQESSLEKSVSAESNDGWSGYGYLDIQIHEERRRIRRRGHAELNLSKHKPLFGIASILIGNGRTLTSYGEIEKKWGQACGTTNNVKKETIHKRISELRCKLKSIRVGIESTYGIGVKLVDLDQDA